MKSSLKHPSPHIGNKRVAQQLCCACMLITMTLCALVLFLRYSQILIKIVSFNISTGLDISNDSDTIRI